MTKNTKVKMFWASVIAGVYCTAPNLTFAGSVFVSGHDSDFHAVAGNTIGAQNIINRALDFTRNGSTAPILLVQSSLANLGLGDHLDSEQGLINSGYSAGNTPGNHYVKVDAAGFLTANLSLYSSIFIPSDHGGTLTGDDLKAINSRSADIFAYLNAGGGLTAFAEDGFHTAVTVGPEPALFGYLPFLVTSAPLGEAENGNTVTAFGASLGLVNSDINGNFSHNVFTATGGMNIVDVDANGEILSLAFRGNLTTSGVPDGGSTLMLLSGVGALMVCFRSRANR